MSVAVNLPALCLASTVMGTVSSPAEPSARGCRSRAQEFLCEQLLAHTSGRLVSRRNLVSVSSGTGVDYKLPAVDIDVPDPEASDPTR